MSSRPLAPSGRSGWCNRLRTHALRNGRSRPSQPRLVNGRRNARAVESASGHSGWCSESYGRLRTAATDGRWVHTPFAPAAPVTSLRRAPSHATQKNPCTDAHACVSRRPRTDDDDDVYHHHHQCHAYGDPARLRRGGGSAPCPVDIPYADGA
jgi:hypothetical protein